MPWTHVTPMEEINRFVQLALSGRFSVTDLSEKFGISRKAGYKHRFGSDGRASDNTPNSILNRGSNWGGEIKRKLG
jgi:hypothetical protein